MRVGDLINEWDLLLDKSANGRPKGIDRLVLLAYASSELREITGLADWDWAVVHLDPCLQLTTGDRTATLPDNFPENFIRWAGDSGEGWVCKLDDGTSETQLDYVSPAQFYSANLRQEANGRPNKYTVISLPSGGRQIVVSPPPDSTATYQIDGLYVPTDWALTDKSSLPPIPDNCSVLKYAVLRRIDKSHENAYGAALANLYMRAATNRKAQLVPMMSDTPYGNDYSGMRRR